MLELLLAFVCLGSNLNDAACRQSWDKFNSVHPEINAYEANLQKKYIDTLPGGYKVVGGVIGVVYKKELRFSIYKNFNIDLRYNQINEQQFLFGYRLEFP